MTTTYRPMPAVFHVREFPDGSLAVNMNLLDKGIATDWFGPDYSLRKSWLGLPPGLQSMGGDLYVTSNADFNSLPWVGVVRVAGFK